MNELIIATLKPLGIPVCSLYYQGIETTYITFFELIAQGGSWANNKETNTEHHVQIDIWSKDNYTDIVTQTKTLLKNIDFHRNYETEMYESDTKTFHKIIRVIKNEDI